MCLWLCMFVYSWSRWRFSWRRSMKINRRSLKRGESWRPSCWLPKTKYIAAHTNTFTSTLFFCNFLSQILYKCFVRQNNWHVCCWCLYSALQVSHRDVETEKRLRKDLKRTKALLADAQIMLDHLKNNAPSKREIAQLKNQVWTLSHHQLKEAGSTQCCEFQNWLCILCVLQLEESEFTCVAAVKARKAMEVEIEDLHVQMDDISKTKQAVSTDRFITSDSNIKIHFFQKCQGYKKLFCIKWNETRFLDQNKSHLTGSLKKIIRSKTITH